MSITIHELSTLTPAQRQALMTRTEADLTPLMPRVAEIVERVRTGGDAAVAALAREIDKAELSADAIAASEADFAQAEAEVAAEVKAAIEVAVGNIRSFHERTRPEPLVWHEVFPGAFAGERTTPIPSVACYVPRGKGSFPSVMLMTTIPAVVAGVPQIAVLTPPAPDGRIDAASLVAAARVGVRRVYKAGGAVAVAAAAYGTQTIPRCAKIVGPGSPWLVAAKRLLADRIDPGLPAGPSEAIVFAEPGSNPRKVALDLLNEAEHGPDSSAFLVTWSDALARAVQAEIPGLWASMGEQRVAFSKAVLTGPRGGIALCRDAEEAVAFTNDYAPEHLMVHSPEPQDWLHRLEHAGEILLGEHTPMVLANYALGPNAVLPTGGHARTCSPLGVLDFMKRTGLGWCTRAAHATLAPHVRVLARYEGFDAHANALELRGD